MDTVKTSSLSSIEKIENNYLKQHLGQVDSDLRILCLANQNRMNYGDGSDGSRGNISGEIKVATCGDADTNFDIEHTLGAEAIVFHVLKIDTGGVFYAGTTDWSSSAITLRCTVANTTMTVFLIK